MLILPNGTGVLDRAQIALSSDQVTWFLSSAAFLANLDHLAAIQVVPYCAICAYGHQPDAVRARLDVDKGVWIIASECRAGDIPVAKVQQTPLAELLAMLGWRLRCPKCQAIGIADGIEGNNAVGSSRLTVSCGCTERVYHAPAVGHA